MALEVSDAEQKIQCTSDLLYVVRRLALRCQTMGVKLPQAKILPSITTGLFLMKVAAPTSGLKMLQMMHQSCWTGYMRDHMRFSFAIGRTFKRILATPNNTLFGRVRGPARPSPAVAPQTLSTQCKYVAFIYATLASAVHGLTESQPRFTMHLQASSHSTGKVNIAPRLHAHPKARQSGVQSLRVVMRAEKRALVPIADGSEEMEAVIVIDTLRRAGLDVTVASVGDSLQVTASRNVKITADDSIGSCKGPYDVIALPVRTPRVRFVVDARGGRSCNAAQRVHSSMVP